MAPLMSLAQASSRPGQSMLGGSRHRSTSQQRQPRSVSAHAASDDKKSNAAIASLSAAALLVSPGMVHPAAAADLTAAQAAPSVLAGSQLTTTASKMAPGVSAPQVLASDDMARTSSGPQANMDDPDAYFDSLERLDICSAPRVTYQAIKYVEADAPMAVMGELADLNADVRDAASDYRDPAIATPQDKLSGAVSGSSSGLSTPDLPSSSDLSDAADAAKSKAKSIFGSGSSSALPTKPMVELADLNADVRDLSKNYRDPAGAIQQDKFTDAVSGSGSPDLSSAGDKLSDAADAAKSKASKMFSSLPTNPLAAVADLNADVRDAASDYRDPAIATPQDKLSGAVSGGSSSLSTPDLPSSSDLSDAADAAKAKAKSIFGSGSSSALPTKPMVELADLNPDVRDLSKNYRDPAGAIQQDKAASAVKDATKSSPSIGSKASEVKSKAKKLVSAAPVDPMGELADLNVDVRDAASDYRDPAIATPQDKLSGAVSGSSSGLSTPDLPSSSDLSDAADAAKSKAKSIFGSGSSSALPTKPMGELADLNADVRDLSKNYRDPAGAIQQDKAASAVKDATKSSPSIGSKASEVKSKAKKMLSAAPGGPMGELADLNADVRDAASDYRDPAIATPQDKLSDAASGSSSSYTPSLDLPSSSDLSDAAKSKAKSLFGSGSSSSLPTNPLAAVADLNADVRDAASDYRDPAIATPQDKLSGAVSGGSSSLSTPDLPSSSDLSDAADAAKSKAKSIFGSGSSSALPTKPMGELADLNADVRDLSKNYRDPVGAIKQDSAAAAKSAASSRDSLSGKASAATGSIKKSVEDLTGTGLSVLPVTPFGDLADLNADVRDIAKDYRDPAGAIQQDKAASAVKDATQGSKVSDLTDAAKSKAKSIFGSGSSSALPTKPMGELADLNADVRDLSKNYRDPAGAIQQDKFTDAVSGSSSPDLSSAGDKLRDAADAAKSKASKMFSALPVAAFDVADLNADVRDDAGGYRDPAGAIQQDKAAGAVKEATKGKGDFTKLTSDSGKKLTKKVKPQINIKSSEKRDIGVGAGYGNVLKDKVVNDSAGIKRADDDLTGSKPKPMGNARLSKPLVRDSLGVKRSGSKNQTGAAGGSDRGALDLAQDTANRI